MWNCNPNWAMPKLEFLQLNSSLCRNFRFRMFSDNGFCDNKLSQYKIAVVDLRECIFKEILKRI